MNTSNKKIIPELLLPAGTYENAQTAFRYGADAIYQGLTGFSLRTGKKAEVNWEELEKSLNLAKTLGKNYYLALNIFAHNDDMNLLEDVFPKLARLSIDGFIVADPGVLMMAKEYMPNASFHISTQANITSYKNVEFWKQQGADRVILARELSREEIIEIKQKVPDIELEIFVHGAMCMAYSGRCNLSLYFLNRDANKGHCAQPCRWEYNLAEDGKTHTLDIEEDKRGIYVFNSKDMNLASQIPDILDIGVKTLKIEGRNKTSYYIANTARVYRKIIDESLKNGANYQVPGKYLEELDKVSHREYSTGFYEKDPNNLNFETSEYLKTYKMVGMVDRVEDDQLYINVRDEIRKGEIVEIIYPDICEDEEIKLETIVDTKNNKPVDSAHNSYTVAIPYIKKHNRDIQGLLIRKKINK